jgi:hypothetical protein
MVGGDRLLQVFDPISTIMAHVYRYCLTIDEMILLSGAVGISNYWKISHHYFHLEWNGINDQPRIVFRFLRLKE